MMPEHRAAISLLEMMDIEDTTCRAFVMEQERVRSRIKKNKSCGDLPLLSAYCWREKVAQWCYDVIDHLGEKRELAYVAMNILDRFNNYRPVDERCYEVEAMSALFLAVRIAGSGNLSLHLLVSMSKENISQRDIIAIGKSMIAELNWDHRLLTPTDFIYVLVGDLSSRLSDPIKVALLDMALYLAELAVFDMVLATKRPSVVGAAATLSAIQRLETIRAESKVELCQLVKSTSARFGDITDLEHRMCLLSNEIPGKTSPHLILDEDDI